MFQCYRWKYQSMSIDGSMPVEQRSSYRYVHKYTDICFQNDSRMQFLGVQKWCSANVFSDTKQNHVCWKICKVFRAKIYCKMSNLFSLVFVGFKTLLENLKLKKKTSGRIQKGGTCGQI